MPKPNEHGVYEPTAREELARRGHAHAIVSLCQCEDGRYRYALDVSYSYGGFSGPISDRCPGFDTYSAAVNAATAELLRRFPPAWPGEPQSVHDELRELRAQIEATFRQPSLF